MQKNYSANLPHKCYTAEQIRCNEPQAAANAGIEMFELMASAGLAMFEMVASHFANLRYRDTTMVVLCGYGNNGGDGYIVAHLAMAAGWPVRLVQLGDVNKITGDADRARQLWLSEGGKVEHIGADEFDLPDSAIIIDAMLGTGLRGEVKDRFADVIHQVNHTRNAAVCSIDIPSGLNADTGQPMGCAIKADMTCTFVGLKQGLLTGVGGDYCGELYFAGLGVERAFEQIVPAAVNCITKTDLPSKFPRRLLASHKGHFGHVVLIGGNVGMSGAIRMAASACMRTGAGLVTVLTHSNNEQVVAMDHPQMMVRGVHTGGDISEWLALADVVVFGPGGGQDAWAKPLLAQVCDFDGVKVIDADGLNLLAQQPLKLNHCIITPHPKEAARLLNTSVAEVQQDRYAAIDQLAKTYHCVALLKGYGTLIGDGQRVNLNTSGNPGMATAGMGDVLSGILSGLLAQGLSLYDAAVVGAYIHGAAGDLAAADGQRGLMATDLFDPIRKLVNP